MTNEQKTELMRELGRLGGIARAKALSKRRLSAIGRKGYKANIANMKNSKGVDKVSADAKK